MELFIRTTINNTNKIEKLNAALLLKLLFLEWLVSCFMFHLLHYTKFLKFANLYFQTVFIIRRGITTKKHKKNNLNKTAIAVSNSLPKKFTINLEKKVVLYQNINL